MNKYLNLLKRNVNLCNTYKIFLTNSCKPFSSINFLNDITRERKIYYINWCQRLEALRKERKIKNTEDFVSFMELSSKLPLDHIKEEAKKILEDFLENNELNVLSDKNISCLIECIANIGVSKDIFNLFKSNFIKRKIDDNEQYFIVFKILFSKDINKYDVDDLVENVIEFYTINMKKLDLLNFNNLLEIYFYLYKPYFQRLLSPIIEYIQDIFEKEPSKFEQKNLLQIFSGYPRILYLNGNEDLSRKEMIKLQQYVSKIKFEMTEAMAIILNNISIYGNGNLILDLLEQNMQNMYKFLTCIDNSNFFHLFFLLTSYKFQNVTLSKKMLKDLIILIKYIKSEEADEKSEEYFPKFREMCQMKIKELKEIIEKRKTNKDIKYSLTFLEVLNKATEHNPITFAEYSVPFLLNSYENMIKILE